MDFDGFRWDVVGRVPSLLLSCCWMRKFDMTEFLSLNNKRWKKTRKRFHEILRRWANRSFVGLYLLGNSSHWWRNLSNRCSRFFQNRIGHAYTKAALQTFLQAVVAPAICPMWVQILFLSNLNVEQLATCELPGGHFVWPFHRFLVQGPRQHLNWLDEEDILTHNK